MGDFKTWRFQALDTWFFRESRPMESVGGSELGSTFPPSPRTLAGAIRHIVGNHHQVNWNNWSRWERPDKPSTPDPYRSLKDRIGDAEGYGDLEFTGAWLARKTVSGETERLYPVPGNLLVKRNKATQDGKEGSVELKRLWVGKPRDCNLGRQVRMPVLPEGVKEMRAADDCWVTEQGLQVILAGGVCCADDLVVTDDLFEQEARLGIAINNQQRAVEEQMLYQTRHVRPKPSIVVETDVKGLKDDDHADSGIARLGGEGRGADWAVEATDRRLAGIKPNSQAIADAKGIVLMLLTPADLYPQDTVQEYLPLPGFSRVSDEMGAAVWKGALHGVALTLHCAIVGKAVREGGWDLVNNKPRAVRSLVPAGSVFYLTVDDDDIAAALSRLHLKQIPDDVKDKQEHALGRGLVTAGLWPKHESMD